METRLSSRVNSTWTTQPWWTPRYSARSLLTTNKRRRGVRKWKTSRLSSKPVIGTFPIGITDKLGQAANRPASYNSISKVRIFLKDRIATIRNHCLTKTSHPEPARVNRRTGATATRPEDQDLRLTTKATRTATMLPTQVCHHQTDWTRKSKLPGTWRGHQKG